MFYIVSTAILFKTVHPSKYHLAALLTIPCLLGGQISTPLAFQQLDAAGTGQFTESPEIRPVEIDGQPMIELRYPQLSGNVGIGNYELAVSTDLSTWEGGPHDIVSTEITGGPLDYVTARFGLSPQSTRFFRVQFDYENART